MSAFRKQQLRRAEQALDDDIAATSQDELDIHRNAPLPDPKCLYGLVGEVAQAGSESTEANPYAIAANFMAFMSAAVGRGPFMSIGDTQHHARLFTLHVGRSGRGRKGDAISLMRRLAHAVTALSSAAAPKVHSSGLSSREGLVFLVHDGYQEGQQEVEPIVDKRLWVIESEFANVLHQGKRQGNTLSTALRDAWDGLSLGPATKTNRLHTTDPHICLSGAVTPTELRDLIAARELFNGFANRFLIFWAERTKMMPFPKATSQARVDELAARIMEVLTLCNALDPGAKNSLRISLSPDAQQFYAGLYLGKLNDTSHGERVNGVLERRAPMLLRIAMLLALCDRTTEVSAAHIDAALAWIRFGIESVKFIFASALDEAAVAETNADAEKIIAYLTAKRAATRSKLSKECFGGHLSRDRLDAAIDHILMATPPRLLVEIVPRPKDSPGVPTKIYRLPDAKSAKSAECEQWHGLQANEAPSEVREMSEMSNDDSATFRTFRTLHTAPNEAEVGASIDVALNSHISPAVDENETEVL